MRRGLPLIMLLGCGRIGFEPRAGGLVPPDAPCTLGAFGVPRTMTELNSPAEEYGPWLSDDGLEILFTSMRTGGFLIFRATRASTDVAFDPPVVSSPTPGALFSDADDPWLTRDGLTMLFDGHNTGAGDLDIFMATRATVADPFDNVTPVAGINTASSETGAALTDDGLTLVFVSSRGGTEDLYLATRATTQDPFTTIGPLPSESTSDDEFSPWLDHDGQTLIYTDSGKLMVATRSGDDFAGPHELDPALDALGLAGDVFLSRNGRTLIWAVKSSSDDLTIAERPCL